jgi:N-acetylmuramoyl-L-alanine amidase
MIIGRLAIMTTEARQRHLRRCATALLALALALPGCAGRQAARRQAIDAAAHRAYRTLVESLGVNTSAVHGRMVVLDPGHGGGYRGAQGTGGAAEADVNLAVALFLWGLLEDAGARVHLTRTADRDFVGGEIHPPNIRPVAGESPASPETGATTPPPLAQRDSLRADLEARVLAANVLAPDLFLSIHHNADASGDTTRNQTQTYYRLGDAGASLDAAQAIHRHLMRNLQTAGGRVRPGNYLVLRQSTAAAAVLGEPSFITNPIFEEKLVRIDRVELEATAYFLGIVDYFSRGVAHAELLLPEEPIDAATVELRARFAGSAIDPATVEFLLDGRTLPAAPVRGDSAESSAWLAAPVGPLLNGRHLVEVRGRCLGGNAAAPASSSFEIRRPPAELSAEPWPPWNGEEEVEITDIRGVTRREPAIFGPLGLEVSVRDRLGMAVADSTPVELLDPAAERTVTRGGQAWFRVSEQVSPAAEWRVRAGTIEATVPVVTAGAGQAWSGTLISHITGKGVAGAELRDSASGVLLGRTTPDGEFAFPAPGMASVSAPGYLPDSVKDPRGAETSLVPVLGGVLHQRGIVIDAAGGGAEPLLVSPTGVRAADTTLDVARRLRAELRRAGARVTLTREDDRTLPETARVEATEAEGPDLVLRIGVATRPRVRHYPGSRLGTPLARSIARELEHETGLALQVRPEVTPLLLHTSMPAVELLLPPPGDQAGEDRHLDPDFRRQVARALLLALAADAGLEIEKQITAIIESEAPRLLLDETVVLPNREESVVIRGLEPHPVYHSIAPLDAQP